MGKSERENNVEHWGEVRDEHSTWPSTVLEPSRTVHYEKHRRRAWPLVLIAAMVALVRDGLTRWSFGLASRRATRRDRNSPS
jgi:hypothetical protein